MSTTPEKQFNRDDINQHLTWGNVAKVMVFLWGTAWSLGWTITQYVAKDKARDYQTETLNKNLVSLTEAFKEFKDDWKNNTEGFNSKFMTLEKRVDIISYDLEVIKAERNSK